MNKSRFVGIWNFFLVIVALGSSSVLALWVNDSSPSTFIAATRTGTIETSPHFGRIASASVIADEILLELCEPSRIVAFTEYSQRESLNRQRFADKDIIRTLDDIEAIAKLNPDLVIAHEISDRRHVSRLQELGIRVLDLGNVIGIDSLLQNISAIGDAVGNRDGALRLRSRLEHELQAAKQLSDKAARHSAMLIFNDGKRLYSVGGRTSYDDVMKYAGLDNLLSTKLRDLQEISTETVLREYPEIIVTDSLSAPHLCRAPGWAGLRYCTDPRTLIVIDDRLLANAGLGIVDTIHQVRNAITLP